MRLTLPSLVEEILFDGVGYYLKRDDLIDPDFSGNKARKFHYYLNTPFSHINKLVSYGSNQSNAMYSLSVLARMRGWRFDYFVDHIPDYLFQNPHGNYQRAIENGMYIHVGKEDAIACFDKQDDTLYIHEGGREERAEYGIEILAREIEEFQLSSGLDKFNIFLPAGTGTTALYLQKHSSCRVYTTPCVGDEEYLKKQFMMLEQDESLHPTIINTNKKYHFGKLYREYYDIWLKLDKQTGVEFDLLYDPKGWLTLLANRELLKSPLLYIHQGGLIGNESMLPRYERKYAK